MFFLLLFCLQITIFDLGFSISNKPTLTLSDTPSYEPIENPTDEPSYEPTDEPTDAPIAEPSHHYSTVVPSVVSVISNDSSNIPYNEWDALRNFYFSTKGDTWDWRLNINSSRWNFDSYYKRNPCKDKWAGIICTCYHYERSNYYYPTYSSCYVEKLVLNKYNLIGTLSSKIGKLSKLKRLFLNGNKIIGTIPTEIGLLLSLVRLGLEFNQFTGNIPSSLSQLTNLREVNFANNALTGTIPKSLNYLTNLTLLDFSHNVLDGSIPSSIGDLKQLMMLYLNNNELSYKIPESIGNLSSLQILYLASNKFNGTIPFSLGGLAKLKELNLAENTLSGPIPNSFGNLSNLVFLDLTLNWDLSGTLPESLSQLSNLKILWLVCNSFSGTLPSSYSKLQNLQNIHIFAQDLFGEIPSSFCQLKNLETLSINYNSYIYGPIPTCLGQILSLKTIEFQVNMLTGTIPDDLGQLRNLTALQLYNNYISGTIPNTFDQLISLTTLNLYNNYLSGTFPSNIGNLYTLQYLILAFDFSKINEEGNIFRGPISSNYCFYPNLKIVTLPGVNSSCYPICLYSRLNTNYLNTVNHCPGVEDIALCDLVDSTDIRTKVKKRYKTESSLTAGSPHPVPKSYDSEDIIKIPYASSYSISIIGLCDLRMDGYVQSRLWLETLNGFEISEISCTSNPIIVKHSSFVIKYYHSTDLDFITYGYELFINAKITINGWKCMPIPQLFIGNNDSYNFKSYLYSYSNYQNYYGDIIIKNDSIINVTLISKYAPDYCSWTGVRCLRNSVYQLILSGLDISGSLPSSLSHLSNLHTLDIKYNSFEKNIPSAITNLSKLVNLDLSFNQFTGYIPKTINEIKNLQNLKLGNNKLSGLIPSSIQDLLFLQSFSANNNDLSSSIPSLLGGLKMSFLTDVDLSFNRLNGPIPIGFRDSLSLSYLNLANNQLTGNIGNFDSGAIYFLRFDSNKLSGKIPESLCRIFLSSKSIFSATANPLITCYESCWLSLVATHSNIFDNKVIFCSPSSQPSSKPSRQPSRQPNSVPLLSAQPTTFQPSRPTEAPSISPSKIPTYFPTQAVIVNGDTCILPNGNQAFCNLGYYCLRLLCYSCPIGQYCPDGIYSYLCPPDLVSPINGLSYCVTPKPSLAPSIRPSNPTNRPIQQEPTFAPSLAIIALGDSSCTNRFKNQSMCFKGEFCLNRLCFTCPKNQYCPDGSHSFICPPDLESPKGSSQCFRKITGQLKPSSGSLKKGFNESNSNTTLINIPIHEREALRALYSSTSGLFWTVSALDVIWDFQSSYSNPCTENWMGITCVLNHNNVSNNYNILQIDLNNRNLIGTISPFIANLSYLTHFRLSNNYLFSTLPVEFIFLKDIQHIDISGNFLSGTIPKLNGWNNIIFLNLKSNLLTNYQIEANRKQSNLEDLNLCDNPLEGSLQDFNVITNLKFLSICDTLISGSIPSFHNLVNLTSLILYNNRLFGQIPNFEKLSNLRRIDVNSNILNGSLPSIERLRYLTYLNFSNNLLTGTLPTFSNLQKLTDVDFSKNNFNGEVPIIGSPLILVNIIFGTSRKDDNLIGSIPSAYCSYQRLQLLSMPLSKLACYPACLYPFLSEEYVNQAIRCPGNEDIALCDFTRSSNVGYVMGRQLRKQQLQYNSPHPIPYLYKSFITVNQPDVRYYHIRLDSRCFLPLNVPIKICTNNSSCTSLFCSNQSVLSITPLKILKPSFNISFDMTTTGVYYGYELIVTAFVSYNGWVCESTTALTHGKSNFKSLSIGSNSFYYANGLCTWTGITCDKGQITTISLNNFNIKGTLTESFNLISTLQVLSLSSNNLKGTIPQALNKLSNLQVLDLSSNFLNGTLPADILGMKSLVTLSLAKNQLSGKISPNISFSLQTVILSNNMFVGEIPSSFGKFSSATIFDFQGNAGITCYQPFNEESSNSLQSQLPPCTPTQIPTFIPSSSLITSEKTSIIVLSIVVGLVLLCVLLISVTIYFYWRGNSNSKIYQETVLSTLPIHSYILSCYENNSNRFKIDYFRSQLEEHLDTINRKDFKDRTVMDILLEFYEKIGNNPLNDEVILLVLRKCLPIQASKDGESIIYIDQSIHCDAWFKVLSSPRSLVHVVETIIDEAYEESSLFCKSLCEVTDIEGTSALDGANYITKKILRQSYYFIKRYEIRDLSRPHHQSQTCIIHEAIDHSDDKRVVVALKFMKNKDSYNNEVLIRSKGGFDSDCVINIITQYDSDCDDWFKRRIEREGFSSHPYLIVMPFGGRNMSEVVSSGELINQSEAGSNTSVIRTVITDVARCLQHIHSKGFVHGDVKPKNIIRRSANSFLLIDLDASASVRSGYAGIKISSAYSPPELVFQTGKRRGKYKYGLKQFQDVSQEDYKFVKAHESQDAWALGMTIFFLLTNGSFFQCDLVGENIIDQYQDLEKLFFFGENFKNYKLSIIQNLEGRSLVSRLLSKDPLKRPTMEEVLHHPFLTGKVRNQIKREKPQYDIFLSYRVDSDKHYAEIIYKKLTEKGFKVFWDKECLKLGRPWQEGFINGLCNSRVFVPLLSRGAFTHQKGKEIVNLKSDSPVDNVLLEYRLAVEFEQREMIELILPIMIGDYDEIEDLYSDYFKSNCHPNLNGNNVEVASINKRVIEILESQRLGMPLVKDVTIADTLKHITNFQGIILEGKKEITINETIEKITKDIQDKQEEFKPDENISLVNLLKSKSMKLINIEESDKLPVTKVNNRSDKLKLIKNLISLLENENDNS